METALVSAVLRTLAPKIFAFLQGNHELRRNLEHDINYIRKELNMIAAAIEDHERSSWGNGRISDVQRIWIQGVRELAYSIEDSIDRFLHRVTREPGASSLRQKGHQVKTLRVRTKFAAEIRELRRKSEEASKLRELYRSGAQSSTPGASASSFVASNTQPPADELVGMDAARDEVLELMREDEGQPKRLKVISIVGFGGLGKTVLARQVYDSVADGEEHAYNPRVWVRASEKGAGDVLKEILRQVHDGNCDDLVECLKFKRFFIVIDDMRTEYWNTIKNAFPKDMGVSSRMIVTTAIHSVANACSADNGHVYVMRALNDKQSRELFFKQTSLEDYAPAEQVIKKCDGLPLALVTTAQLLQSNKCQMTPAGCTKLCRYMGEHVENEETLARLKHILLQNYSNLPGHALKACLLYLSIFPSGHPIKRKCLIRRWLAEGFVEADNRRSAMDVAIDNFKVLTDRSIIKPIGISNNTEAKTCQTHGMMLEFILQKSIRENFITSLYDQAGLPDKIRRLSLHRKGATRDKINSNVDFSLVRSLTIFGEAGMHIVEFSKYELLRVLDLEECEVLKDEHVKKISNLLMLRYLSLGGNITTLPKEISNLKFLETLDVRRAKTQIIAMPIEVIKLPSLIHLLGVFRLPDVRQEMRDLQSFLSKKSSLETLAGFVADQSTEFPKLMRHMTRLTKLKLWCLSTADGSNSCFSHLSSPIQEFIQRGTDVNDAPSLSLNFEGCSQDFLDFNLEDDPCYLSSLKLHGELRSLPLFVTKLGSVTELCLSSSGQLSGYVLAGLSNVRSLHYLKLITTELDFVIEQGALKALRRLCVVVRSLTRLENQEGALPHLESLWLLCKDLNGLSGVRIERLRRIKEVALDDAVSEETRNEWKEAAKKHPRRPRICLVKTKEENDIDQMQRGGQTREISHSPAATSPEAENQMQVGSGSKASIVNRKRKVGALLFFSSRKANGTVAAEISSAGSSHDAIPTWTGTPS